MIRKSIVEHCLMDTPQQQDCPTQPHCAQQPNYAVPCLPKIYQKPLHVSHLLATVTTQEWHLFHSELPIAATVQVQRLFKGSDCSRVASIWRHTVHMGEKGRSSTSLWVIWPSTAKYLLNMKLFHGKQFPLQAAYPEITPDYIEQWLGVASLTCNLVPR